MSNQISEADYSCAGSGSNSWAGLWTAIEASLAIVAACLPSLGPLVQIVIGKDLSEDSLSKGASKGQTRKSYRSTHHPFTMVSSSNSEGLERILDRGPQGREEAEIMDIMIPQTKASVEARGGRESHELTNFGGGAGLPPHSKGILVVKDLDQTTG